MKLSLGARVSYFVALVVVVLSAVSSYTFISSQSEGRERRLLARGSALSYALSKSAEEGLVKENLDLLKRASYIVRADDVLLAQVYSTIWEAVDAYPFVRLKEPPHPSAVAHFKSSDEAFYVRNGNKFDFYEPVEIRPMENSPGVRIGYVRLVMSAAYIKKGIRETVVVNIIVAAIIALAAIASINFFLSGLLMKPITALHEAMGRFKGGAMPEPPSARAAGEIKELHAEFGSLCSAVKEKEERLVESEKRLKSLFERVEHGIFRLDAEGRIIESNSRFKSMFGSAESLCEVMGRDKTLADCLNKASSDKAVHFEEKALGARGEELIVSVSLYREVDGEGNVTGYDGYVIDITDKRRLEERLLRTQKLDAVGTLAGGIAHDFNNLLAAILGYSEILLDMAREGDPVYKPASIIHNAARRGAELTQRILTVTRKEKLESRSVNINEAVKNSIELIQRSIPKNIEISTVLGDLPNIKADPSQIQQVVLNLAVNARDAMPEGGRLTIETSVLGMDSGTESLFAEKGGFIKLSVSDTGVGMNKETQSKIFDPFFTTKGAGKGTGLGLYIVHSIVSNHGGYINFYSEPLKGSRFNVYLPITRALETLLEEEPRDMTGTGTILVIDDESDVREICRDMLEPLGYSVVLAAGGAEGLSAFRSMKDGVSVVILDMIMPQMSGREVFHALKTMKPDVKVLLCSGYSQNGFAGIDELIKEGAKGFVQKPFSRQALSGAIKKAAEEA